MYFLRGKMCLGNFAYPIMIDLSIETEVITRPHAIKWLSEHRESIEELLANALKKETLLVQSLREQYGDKPGLRPFSTVEDIYSNPFCDNLKIFSDTDLQGALVKQVGVRIRMDGQTEKKVGLHYIFRLPPFVIDPTFGQFVNLDKAISQHPKLFSERILVATDQEVQDAFGLSYIGG